MSRKTLFTLAAAFALFFGMFFLMRSSHAGGPAKNTGTLPGSKSSAISPRLAAALARHAANPAARFTQDQKIAPNAAGMPNVLDTRSALSAELFTHIGGRGTQFSELTLLANNDGREDFAADRAQTVDDFSFTEVDIDFTLTRTAVSEHTFANGFGENVFYYGDSAGNFWIGTDTNPGLGSGTQSVDAVRQIKIPELFKTGSTGGFNLLSPGQCTSDQVTVTGIAVNPVADLSDFSAACGTIGEVVYVSILDTGGCSSNAANQPLRTRILAFAITDGVGAGAATPLVTPAQNAIQIFSSTLSNSGIAIDDDGSLYFHLVDLAQFTGGAIFKATEIAHISPPAACALPVNRVNRTITSIATVGLTSVTPLSSASARVTNYSSGAAGAAGTITPAFGNIVALATGPNNVLYAALSRSLVSTDDQLTQATEGQFPNPAGLGNTPSMIISFADVTGGKDACTTGDPTTGTLPIADGYADVAQSGLTLQRGVNNFRVFALGTGPDIRPAPPATSPIVTTQTLKVDMQIDYSMNAGLSVDEEGTLYVVSGGAPAGSGLNPSPSLGEILAFTDRVPYDRRADFIDFRGNALPNPPASGGNVGDGDSDRFDHIYWQAPLDQVTRMPTGISGLSRGLLRYTNRLAPNPISTGVTLGNTEPIQGDDSTTSAVIRFDDLDPGHQVAGGDDQNTPFRGDDSDGAGNPAITGVGTERMGGFEFTFGGTGSVATSVWNGFFLNSNGSITFGNGDISNFPSPGTFRSGLPKIAPAWSDLNTQARSVDARTFPVQALGFASTNAFKIRWINTPEFASEMCTGGGGASPFDIVGAGASNTFAITLYDDGTGPDENQNQGFNPANPIGNNSVNYNQEEGPTDLRTIRDPITNALVFSSPRREGSGNFYFDYSRMDLIGDSSAPNFVVLTGYSIGFLAAANPPGLCEINLSEAARSSDGPIGNVQGQTATIQAGLLGEGTEPTLFEFFNTGTPAAPDFDLRFEGNDLNFSPATQPDKNRTTVGFFGIGIGPPSLTVPLPGGGSFSPISTIVLDPFAITPTTAGLVNAIGPITLNILGSGFFPNEVTTVCPSGGESAPRAGKAVVTSASISIDSNGDAVPEAVIPLTNVTVVSANSVRATIPTVPGLPGTAFPLAVTGGLGTLTVTTAFTFGDNNVFGPFTTSATAFIPLGNRAPVVTSVTPSSGDCGAVQSLALVGASFQYGAVTTTDVIATEIGNLSNVIHASSLTVVDANHVNATINFGGTSGKSFLIQAVSSAGTSRDMLVLPPLAPPPLGNEAGNIISFSCGENFQFSGGVFGVTEDLTIVPITITRGSPSAGSASVDISTSDGSALQKTDYTTIIQTITFASGETSKVVNIPITEDAFVEGNESFNLTLSNPSSGTSIGGQSFAVVNIVDDDFSPGPNSIDDAADFVGQNYHDFLNRQADAPGQAFWLSQITACGANVGCIEAARVTVSASFFLSIEFQESGFNVLRTQRVAFGKQSANAATRYPYFSFLKDSQQVGQGVIIGNPGATALLEANKQAYATNIVNSAAFIALYPLAQTAAQYVDALFASAALAPTTAERNAAIAAFGGGGTSGRIAALRSIVDSTSVRTAESNPAFVLMEYYGYLRRNPTDPPDGNDAGYQFWLTKLNSFGGNFINAEMVKAFITSLEYRSRFGAP